MIEVLAAKLQRVVVTQSNYNYKGSITIDQHLMDLLCVFPYQKCIINGKDSRNDITYVIPGERGSGIIGINGALSTKHKEGDEIHVLFFELFSSKDIGCMIESHNISVRKNKMPVFPIIIHTKIDVDNGAVKNIFDKYDLTKHI